MSGRRCGYRPRGGTGGRGPSQTPARAHHVAVERVEAAVAKAQRDLLDAGEHVSAWKVSQSTAEALQFDSWGAVGLRFYDVPALRTLQSIEAKINAFIHCFVCVRKMTSVHELETEVCRNEGVEKFEELGLGPLLRHPLVQHYFSVPPDAKEVCKITTEDLVGRLNVFLYRCKHKEVVIEEFLDFLVQRHSAQSKEALGVRIQSLGLCIKFIKGVRRMESAALKHVEESGSLIKEAPERTSSVFLDHLKSFSSWFGDDNDDGQCSSSAQVGKGMKGRKIRGKNALIVEETKFPGQKLAMSNDLGNDETVGEEGVRSHELIQTVPKKVEKLNLKDEDLKKFITTWMGACQNHSVAEVLAMMLHMYVSSDKRKRKMQKLFLSYPAVGLLNVAVRVIKCGTMGNILKDIDVQESLSPCSIVDMESAGHSPATEVDSELCDDKCMEKDEHRVSVKDIIKQIANYVELVHLVPGKIDLPLVKQLVLHDCEMQVRTQFSVKDFQSLGYGTFFEFLEKFASQLPNQLHYLLTGESSSQSYLEVSILQKQLLVLLSQAARNLGIGNDLTKQFISFVLKQQFPTISFEIMGSEPEKGFLNLTKSQENCEIFCSVLFSAALFGNCCRKKLKSHIEQFSAESSQMIAERDQMTYTHSSVACKDAIECLLKAPMLSDLRSWSHWDLIFAPSLGPLLEWLLNVGSIKELSCVVTSEGRIIRIDQLASIDEFFEATIQGSSFKAAVKLLSLFCVYRGSNNVPLSLLTCYAQRAIDVRIRNFVDHLQADATKEIVANRSSLAGQCLLDKDDSLAILADPSSTIAGSDEDRKTYEDLCRVNKAYSAVAMFILECLGHLPSEFRSFAADILVMGMRSFTKDATKFILLESNHISQRIMLHEIGLSLGIVEWIDDYYAFSSATAVDLFMPSGALTRTSEPFCPGIGMHSTIRPNVSTNIVFSDDRKKVDTEGHAKMQTEQQIMCHVGNERSSEDLSKKSNESLESVISRDPGILDANLLIESIRLEEFGLDSGQKETESILLQKQHARLGRALHCLAEELYSKDSHFLLELVQNADDNSYAESVEPTLVFILQHNGITILNNEKGFYAQNIRALCDVGSSTKKGSSAGYIGKKGIGFKSVFRVTDAPEIHSNGFHVKFDISDGQIGFVLPTVIPPCDIKLFQRQLSFEFDQTDSTSWNTCIILPFKPKLKKGTSMSSIVSMFSDLHPSLLLFLHRLRCIKFKNVIDDKLIVMRRENLRDGIVMVSHAKEKMSWLVVSQNLQASTIRPDVQTTKISIAFPLKEIDKGNYIAHLEQQPAFAFLPLRKYGLKFILQGDFVLPSSREEVDGDNAWNQWLLSEFPDLFVSAEKSFCGLACFQESPAKAVTAYMSYVPLVGEVYGFFSQLPCMIISKLRTSNCLLLDDPNVEWVPPSRVLRGWDEEARIVLSVDLLQRHLGLGYLSRDIILPDSLAKALGIKEYGPKVLVEILSSICQFGDNMKSVSLDWLSSWLNALYTSLLVYSSGYLASENIGTESDVISNLKEISFIPLSDGSYGSVAKGPIWLPCDAFSSRFEGGNGLEHFPCLYAKLQTVNPLLFSTTPNACSSEEARVDNLIRMLRRIGVKQLSAHEVIKNHILPSISDEKSSTKDATLMIEYLSFVMIHLQSTCPNCQVERSDIISNLQKKSILLTNHGFKCPIKEPIHFGKEFGNSIDAKKLIDGMGIVWHEVDVIYLKHPSSQSPLFGLMKWREFFQELGVTDFVQVIHAEKNVADVLNTGLRGMPCVGDLITSKLVVEDWESPELVELLCTLSAKRELQKSRYLLEVLDNLWDDYFSTKVEGYSFLQNEAYKNSFKSSLMKNIHDSKWVASSIGEEVHYPKDLFYDCESVRSILGDFAPYAVPKVMSKKCLDDMGFKVQVTLDDALKVIRSWKNFENPCASISQMSKFYSFIWNELATSMGKISEVKSSLSIFIPWDYASKYMDVVPGKFMPLHEVYWHEPTGCVDRMRETILQHSSTSKTKPPACITPATLYPELHDFFVNACGMLEVPPFGKYLHILLQLSSAASPSEAAHEVFEVLLKWASDLKSGQVKSEEILELKESLHKLENTVLPTKQGKWVSLHPSYGLICWSDDEELMEQYMHFDDVHFLEFGELTASEKELFSGKVAALMQNIGIPALSEVVSREAIFYGRAGTTEKALLVNWVLPYVQRYIYKLHPDIYFHLKQFEFRKISELQVIEVERLYYKNTLKGHPATNSKRIECSCLLQGNILYANHSAESHSLFLELSRFFFHGIPELHMANFLHVITIKAELDSSNEHLESFIINSQKLLEIPNGEPIWSLSSLNALNENNIYGPTSAASMTMRYQYPNLINSPVTGSSWPPKNLKSAPDIQSASRVMQSEELSDEFVDNDFQVEDDPRTTVLNKESSASLEPSINLPAPEQRLIHATKLDDWDSLCLGIPDDNQLYETGRLGENIAYKYFSKKLDSTMVKWVNEESEMGLPYDLIIGEEENREYVEVKATSSTSKDWFPISVNEWHYATEKGDSFSIARVILSSPTNAKVLVLKNPLKLCQENVLQLAVLMPYSIANSTA